MSYTFSLIIKLGITIALAVFLGNGSVVVFNRLPVKWFEDWKDDNSEEERVLPDRLLQSIADGRQRITSTPWKVYAIGLFGVTGAFLATRETLQFSVAVMLVLAILLLMAVADYLYMIVPDQLIMLLAVSAVGFVGLYENWWEMPAGALVGFGLSALVWVLGKLIYKKECIGGADIKFYATMGLVCGRTGIVVIFVLTTIFTLIHSLYYMFINRGLVKGKEKTSVPMLPSAFIASFLYLVFLWDLMGLINL